MSNAAGGSNKTSTNGLSKSSKDPNSKLIPSTLDPSNPLSLTTATKMKKLPTRERVITIPNSTKSQKEQSQTFTQASSTAGKLSLSTSQKGFKIYSTMQSQQQQTPSTCKNYRRHTSPKVVQQRSVMLATHPSEVSNRTSNGGNIAANPEKNEESIMHSQEQIKRSRDQRLNSGNRVVIDEASMMTIGLVEEELLYHHHDEASLQTVSMASQSSPKMIDSARKNINFSNNQGGVATDETTGYLKHQLDEERKKHREMKKMFEDTIQNMEQQSRAVPKQTIELNATKAVDEIMNKGKPQDLLDQVSRQAKLIEEHKERENDLQNTNQLLEKKLLHAQMREKETQAKGQFITLQNETQERKLHFELERLKEQVKDLKNNEEQLKSDHAQNVLDLTDQIEEVRSRQVAETEERFLRQISEIKSTHARERENLIQQKFQATQELQLIKMDHSELIRNTNFEEQRDLVETITAQQAQIQHLTILLGEQEKNSDLAQRRLEQEKGILEQKVRHGENSFEKTEAQRAVKEKELSLKIVDLEGKLGKAAVEKDEIYKNQMEKIQENLSMLKEQIYSTNQSLIDQSQIGGNQLDQSSLALGLARLNSPDFHTQRHRRNDPISQSSPRVPRAFARLNNESQQLRMQSPLAALYSRRQREKSTDRNIRAIFSGSSEAMMQEQTQVMSSGTNERTATNCDNLESTPADQVLFNHSVPQQQQINALQLQQHNSFLLDPMFPDYYMEYVMLYKLEALTNNFTCQNCWQVLNFSKFFDDDHECLKKIVPPGLNDQASSQHVRQQSNLQADDIEELKEARAMLGPSEGVSSLTAAQVSQPGANASAQVNNNEAGEAETYYRRKGVPPLSMVKHNSLPGQLRNNGNGTTNGNQIMATSSFQSANSNSNLEMSMDAALGKRPNATIQAPPVMNVMTNRDRVNAMQLDVYVLKLKEYRATIDELEKVLQKCRSENESLIFDLRDCKTKVAVLEENKAQLQMELQRERKRQIKQVTSMAKSSAEAKIARQKSPQQPQLNVTVNTISQGVFGLGGKSIHSVKVQPALKSSSQHQQSIQTTNQHDDREDSERANHQQQQTPLLSHRQNLSDGIYRTNPKEQKFQHQHQQHQQQLSKQDRSVFRSPTTRMVPLSQKFSAFPVPQSDASMTMMSTRQPNTVYGQTRNMNDLSIISRSDMVSKSYTNLTQKLSTSTLNLRHHQDNNYQQQNQMLFQQQQNLIGDHSHGPMLLQTAPMMYEKRNKSIGNESCDISPEREGSTLRRKAHHGYNSTGQVIAAVVDVDADLSSMNPLVTPGVDLTDREENRCSFFDANSANRGDDEQRRQVPEDQTSSSDVLFMFKQQQEQQLQEDEDDDNECNDDSYHENQNEEIDLNQFSGRNLTKSQKMIRLNNPYDMASINRQRLIEDSPDNPIDYIEQHSSVNTRATVTPGTNHPKPHSMDLEASKVVIKTAVPLRTVSLDSGSGSIPEFPSRKYGSKRAPDEPFRVEDL